MLIWLVSYQRNENVPCVVCRVSEAAAFPLGSIYLIPEGRFFLLTIFLWLGFQDAAGRVKSSADKYGGEDGNKPSSYNKLRDKRFTFTMWLPHSRDQNIAGWALMMDVHGWRRAVQCQSAASHRMRAA